MNSSTLLGKIHELDTEPHPIIDDELSEASVMVLLHKHEEELCILLTERAAHLKHHASQISFPGGRFETNDKSLLETALRETEEEVGVSAEDIQVIGQLEPVETLTGYRIYPYVGYIEVLPELNIDPNEVADAFSVKATLLLDAEKYRRVEVEVFEQKRHFYELQYEERRIWGATAGILYRLARQLS